MSRKLSLQPYFNGLVVQLVRMSACHAEGRGFESRPDRLKPQFFWGFLLLKRPAIYSAKRELVPDQSFKCTH